MKKLLPLGLTSLMKNLKNIQDDGITFLIFEDSDKFLIIIFF